MNPPGEADVGTLCRRRRTSLPERSQPLPFRKTVESSLAKLFAWSVVFSLGLALAASAVEIGADDFTISDAESVLAAVEYGGGEQRYLAVWGGLDPTGTLGSSEYEIWGQLIDAADGQEFGTNFRISAMGQDGDNQFQAFAPAVAYSSIHNQFLVVWTADDPAGDLMLSEFEIWGQLIDAETGLETGPDDLRITFSGADGDPLTTATLPDVAYAPDLDVYCVVWKTGFFSFGGEEIRGQLLDGETLAPLGADFQISETTSAAPLFPAVTYNPNADEFLVVWSGIYEAGMVLESPAEWEIWGQRIAGATGAEVGSNDFRISSMGPEGSPGYWAIEPDVAYLAATDRYLVAWSGQDHVDDPFVPETQIWGQLLDGTTGAEVGPDDFLISHLSEDAGGPAVAASEADLQFFVLFQGTDDASGPEAEVFGQLVDGSTGAEQGEDDERLSSMGPVLDSVDAAWSADTGEYLAVWSAQDDEGVEETRVYGQRYAGNLLTTNYALDLTRAELDARHADEIAGGNQMVDIEVRWDGAVERYYAIWRELPGTVHSLIQGEEADWLDFLAAVEPLAGRFLDVEVGYFDSIKKFSALFYEDGDSYGWAVHTNTTDEGMQTLLDQYLREDLSIIDFEAYVDWAGACDSSVPDGAIRYSGTWARDPNQPRTHLFYGLESADVSDLLRPLAGRVIDLERYCSPVHDEHRWAMILAMYPGEDWGVWRNLSPAELAQKDAENADANTVMLDLDVWSTGGEVLYGAVWGDTDKALHEVAGMGPVPSPIPRGQTVENLISCYEEGVAPPGEVCTIPEPARGAGTIGLYGVNLQTGQSLGYREDEMFYLASVAKLAIHIRLWQEVEAGELSLLSDTINYTEGANSRDLWYVDERPNLTAPVGGLPAGFNACNDSGVAYTLNRFDQAMMRVSDNAATSALVDHLDLGLSHRSPHDDLDLNGWLSGLSGIGQGWGSVTSIHDVDRAILWQGQVMDHPDEPSFFLIPGWVFEPYMRPQPQRCSSAPFPSPTLPACLCSIPASCSPHPIAGTNGDEWCDLYNYLGQPASMPTIENQIGHQRYFRQGLNSATPRAVGELFRRYAAGDLMGPVLTAASFLNMKSNTVLDDNFTILPGLTVREKNGDKGRSSGSYRVNNQVAAFFFGPEGPATDSVIFGVYTKDDSAGRGVLNPDLFAPLGWAAFQRLVPNLEVTEDHCDLRTRWVAPGGIVDLACLVANIGGANSGPFDLELKVSGFLTTTSSIELVGDSDQLVDLGFVLPAGVASSPKTIIVTADPRPPMNNWGAVGEWDEGDNLAFLDLGVGLGFADGFDTGSAAAWSFSRGPFAVLPGAASVGSHGLRVSVESSCSSPTHVSLFATELTGGVVEACTYLSTEEVTVVSGDELLRAGEIVVLGEGTEVLTSANLTVETDPSLDPSAFVQDDSPAKQRLYNAYFHARFDGLETGDAAGIGVFAGYTEDGTIAFRLEVEETASPLFHQIRALAREDSGALTSVGTFQVPAGWNDFRVSWVGARAGQSDGSLEVYLDGVSQVLSETLANSSFRIDRVRLGVVSGVDTTSSGHIDFDAFVSW